MTLPLSVVVLTHNEERNLPACLKSVEGWASEVFVVDSFSTDRTIAIAEAYRAKVVRHPFETHAKQWRWALDNLPIGHEWVLGLDADQRLTPELRHSIAEALTDSRRVDGFYLPRRQVFRGRWIRHGGYYPVHLLKLFRRDAVRCDQRELMDHHFYVAGITARLAGDLVEENENERSISSWVEKHNGYARLQALEDWRRETGPATEITQPSPFGGRNERVLWLKRIYRRLPLFVRPALYFAYRYLLRLGFLDGKEGFVFHFLQGFWYRLLVDINIDELRRDASRRPTEGLAGDRGERQNVAR